uniref:Uncharacterized protein n=1 Tax=viral metagenome TaxID=1070528 RepID=A0A6M3JL06_9ZZZZ
MEKLLLDEGTLKSLEDGFTVSVMFRGEIIEIALKPKESE